MKKLLVVFVFLFLSFALISCDRTTGGSPKDFDFLDWPTEQLPTIPVFSELNGKVIRITNNETDNEYDYRIYAVWNSQYEDVNTYINRIVAAGWEDNTFVDSQTIYWNETSVDVNSQYSSNFSHCDATSGFYCSLNGGSISVFKMWNIVPEYSEENMYFLVVDVVWNSNPQ